MIIRGAEIAKKLTVDINDSIDELMGIIPCITIIRVGEKAADLAYQRGAVKKLSEFGIKCVIEAFPMEITQDEFIENFKRINDDESVHGILLMRPLPDHLDDSLVERIINPLKDVDGISPMNLAGIYLGNEKFFAPCTPQAVMEILESINYELRGKKVVIVGCGKVVGKPLSLLMMAKDATVVSCNEFTRDLVSECKDADVLISAAGVRNLIGKEHISSKTVVIDVGINLDENNKLCGDVNFNEVSEIVFAITPVPGGVGSITTHVLAKHLIKAVKNLMNN
ncbi:bifunctional 5,10-methylenetetrahydrofolate dehydrogenase/5,10-methenyltetrahydrofolate cyclohydrolase [Peptoniphilus sp. oral taxon 386]|uniref:bifunctional 5,10-methylenetetrahydrofolate dehydrogenase/5,10-methenyltetrahydrofolate cyclohydrolase n=1 Tax=Peptoniphilus sp. oral taxon 386 TaxID=652713 RepID=UPI0001DA9ABA|nr:bifunctional 5,10-methylenetetrahydrofolate dehydrogenase/5,10-methenyltetrahydrofolate cyclohydrolase [Peptoniphilus sp. oral taxon 386]EFI42004.1 tetrahydrofolate dehydrogenase/cyclohydrolase, NAD(P)-binding domain protein [Peptoniphilus sp. oral taxon 386 str. F0131]